MDRGDGQDRQITIMSQVMREVTSGEIMIGGKDGSGVGTLSHFGIYFIQVTSSLAFRYSITFIYI